MSEATGRRALEGLKAIGALKKGDGASLERQAAAQVDDSFPTYAWNSSSGAFASHRRSHSAGNSLVTRW